jgi:hypothetical protein
MPDFFLQKKGGSTVYLQWNEAIRANNLQINEFKKNVKAISREFFYSVKIYHGNNL